MKQKPKTAKPSPAKHAHDIAHSLGIHETNIKKILSDAGNPLSAYDIIPLLSKKTGHRIAPPTVYRALQHLTEHGLVTRIESRNAYVLCQHPHESHDCLFLICRQCDSAIEAPDSQISKLLRKEARALGFDVSRQILEIVGLCRTCTA
jgi:Fur family zinc uptake transcriptional regulator